MKKLLTMALTLVFVISMANLAAAQGKPWDIPAKYKAMKNTKKGDAESIKLGKTLYTKHCKSCHGNSKGDGPKAASLKTKMNDFASAEFKALPDGTKYYMTYIGRDEMPAFEKKIVDEEERWAIINYLNSL